MFKILAGNRSAASRLDRFRARVAAYVQRQNDAWGGLDEAIVTRYVMNWSDQAERAQVEKAMKKHKHVREWVDAARAALNEPLEDLLQLQTDSQNVPGSANKPAAAPF